MGGVRHKFAVVIDVPDRLAPSYSTPPPCPEHGSGGNVRRDGTYGPKKERVQRGARSTAARLATLPRRPKYAKGVHYFTKHESEPRWPIGLRDGQRRW